MISYALSCCMDYCRACPARQQFLHCCICKIVSSVNDKGLSKRRKKEAGVTLKERRTIEVGRSTHTKKRVHRTEKGISKVKGRERIGTKAEPSRTHNSGNKKQSGDRDRKRSSTAKGKHRVVEKYKTHKQ